jgi:hypothetical protein
MTACLQCVPIISPLTPVTAVAPLLFVIGVSMFRDAFEDYKRHQNDKESNNTLILALRPVGKESSFTPIKAE